MSIKSQIRAFNRFLGLAKYGKNKIAADDCRLAVKPVIGGYLHVDTDRLDIFSNTSVIVPEWRPKIKLQAYADVTKICLDIETDGGVEICNYQNYKDFPIADYSLKMIGVRNEKGVSKCIQDTEENMLRRFLKVLNAYKPQMLLGYNHIKFDLPFLIAKFEQYGLEHPFFISDHISIFRTAQHFGKPTTFHAVYCSWGKGDHKIRSHVIDIYQQVLAFDFVSRKLTSYSLKEAALQLSTRKQARLDLGFDGLLDCYAREDWDTVKEYLEYDLEDTHKISDLLLPAVYYQALFCIDFSWQALATMGNATKWNSILKNEYNGVEDSEENSITFGTGETIYASPKRQFKGGKTGAFAGFNKHVSKIDVSSLYPAIQLKYGICSDKDPERYSLAILLYCRTVRIGFKTLKNLVSGDITGDMVTELRNAYKAIMTCFDFCIRIGYSETLINDLSSALGDVLRGTLSPGDYKDKVSELDAGFFRNEGVLKIFINSGYGFLGTTGIPFNDQYAAALIPAYGRLILTFMVDFIKSKGGNICGIDTDGVYYTMGSIEANTVVYEQLCKELPDGIEIAKELDAEALFIPPTVALCDYDKNYKVESKLAYKFWVKTWGEEDEDKEIWAENPELIEESYQWILSHFPGKRLTHEVFLAAAKQFDFTFPKTEGLRKNYVVFTGGNKVKAYGRYKKRDQTVLAKTWQIEYLKMYKQDPAIAEQFYLDTVNRIETLSYPVKDLSITKKIPKGSKELLSVGAIGDVVTYYHGVDGYTVNGQYSAVHYVSVVDTLYNEIQTVLEIAKQNGSKLA